MVLYTISLYSDGRQEASDSLDPKSFFPQGTKYSQISVAGGLTLFYVKQKGGQMNANASSLVRRMITGNAVVSSTKPINIAMLQATVSEKQTMALVQARDAVTAFKDGGNLKGRAMVRGKMPAELHDKKIDLQAIDQMLQENVPSQ
jgi:hypothetical protein